MLAAVIEADVLAAAVLTEHATLSRYPGADSPAEEDVATALRLVTALWEWFSSVDAP